MKLKETTLKFLFCVLCLSITGNGFSAEKFRFGVYPHLPSRDLEKVYAPIAEEFSHVLNLPVSFESSSSFENFNDRLDQDDFDIVFVQPFDYVRIADAYGYRPLAMRGEQLFIEYAVKLDSNIHQINDLKGKKLALPPSISAVSRLAKVNLTKNGLLPMKDLILVHRRSHMSCLQQVLINQADACATAAPVLRFFESKMKTKFRVIGKSISIPHTLFAVHPRVSKERKQKLKELILSWGNTDKGREILNRGKLKSFQSINDADYNIVRNLSR